MRKMNIILIFVLLSISILPSFAQQNARVAVLPFVSVNTSKSDTKVITSLFEIALLKTGVYSIIEQNQIERVLDAQSYSISACTDSACAVEIGELLSAELIIIGEFSRLGSRYIANAKIIDVALGKNINADSVTADSMNEMTDESVQLLAYKLVGISSEYFNELETLEKELDEYSGTEEEAVQELEKAHTLYDEILASDYTYRELEDRSSQLLQKALMNRIDELNALKQIDEKRNKSMTNWQLLGFGTGIAGFAATGVFYYLYQEELEVYNNTNITAVSVESRDKLELYNMIELGGVIAGGAGTVTGILFSFKPDTKKYDKELKQLSAEYAKIKGASIK